MADIVNLRMARKARARAENETTAAANRLKFGVSKPEKSLRAAHQQLDDKRLDAHQRDDKSPVKP